MRYLVNRKTKEHQRMPFDCLYAPSGWRIVQADSEGWIAHTGKECPLPEDGRCEITEGDWKSGPRQAAHWSWVSVSHYRPILEPEKVQEPEPTQRKTPDLVVTRDGVECADQKAALLEFKMQCLEASERGKRLAEKEAERKHMEIKESELKRMMLLDRLKTAHEAAQQIPDLEAELREVLGSMGYDLVARSPFANQCCCNPAQCWEPCGVLGKSEAHVAVSPEPDMSDWRNWREGDLLKCVNSKGWDCFDMGDIYRVTKHDCAFICVDGVAVVKQYINDFRFHSRPAKGE